MLEFNKNMYRFKNYKYNIGQENVNENINIGQENVNKSLILFRKT